VLNKLLVFPPGCVISLEGICESQFPYYSQRAGYKLMPFKSHHAFCESLQLANNSSCFCHTAAERKSCKLDFFLRYESVFSEALSDARAVLERLEQCREIDASQKEVGVFTWVKDTSSSPC